jgi:hypothetical protein
VAFRKTFGVMMRRPKGLPDAASRRAHSCIATAMPARFGEQQPDAASRRAHSCIATAMPARFGEQQPVWLIPSEFLSHISIMSGSKLGVVLPRYATGRPVAHLAREGEPLPLHPTPLPLRGIAGTIRPGTPTRVWHPRPASGIAHD